MATSGRNDYKKHYVEKTSRGEAVWYREGEAEAVCGEQADGVAGLQGEH